MELSRPPKHWSHSIEQLARQHFYDGLTFFRVIDDFMDQTGDPQNSGAGGSNQPNVKSEFDFKYSPTGAPAPLANISGVDLLSAVMKGTQSSLIIALVVSIAATAVGAEIGRAHV